MPPLTNSVIAAAALPADAPTIVLSAPNCFAVSEICAICASVAAPAARSVFRLLVSSLPWVMTADMPAARPPIPAIVPSAPSDRPTFPSWPSSFCAIDVVSLSCFAACPDTANLDPVLPALPTAVSISFALAAVAPICVLARPSPAERSSFSSRRATSLPTSRAIECASYRAGGAGSVAADRNVNDVGSCVKRETRAVNHRHVRSARMPDSRS